MEKEPTAHSKDPTAQQNRNESSQDETRPGGRATEAKKRQNGTEANEPSPADEKQREPSSATDQARGFKFRDRRVRVDSDKESDEEEIAERKPTYVEQLEQRANKAEEQLAEYIKAYKEKVEVEWQAYKKRLERESHRQLEQDRKSTVAHLIEVLDNLELSLTSAQTSGSADALVEGVRLVYGQFLAELQALGLELINAENQTFDPALHEAVSIEPTDDANLDGKVVEVYKRGYTFSGTLLRPAMVRVARKQS